MLLLFFYSSRSLHLYGQQRSQVLEFKILEGMDCSAALEAFKGQFQVLVAYDPSLNQLKNTVSRELVSDSKESLFEKLCNAYQLEYKSTEKDAFLVRTNAKTIKSSSEVTLHIKLVEHRDGSPIAYAAIFDESKKYYAFTDEYGDCFLRLPKKMTGQKLTVHSLAHENKEVIFQAEPSFQTITLNDEPNVSEAVHIQTIKKKMQALHDEGIHIHDDLLEKLSKNSIFSSDVLRTMQMLAGVNVTNDSKASIRIRGAHEDATLLMLDHMPIYKADHFYGIFGAFNNYYVDKAVLFKNNIPVEYGGRTSGMVKLESTRPRSDLNVQFDINLLFTGVSAEIPLSKSWALKVAGRKSYTNLVRSKFYDLSKRDDLNELIGQSRNNLILSIPKFDFEDYNAKLSYSKGNHSFEANAFLSNDKFKDSYTKSFKIKNITVNTETFSQISTWANQTFGANHRFENKDIQVLTSAYHTAYRNQYDIFSNLLKREQTGFIRDSLQILNHNLITDQGIKSSIILKKIYHWQLGGEHILHNNELYIENGKTAVFELIKAGRESNFFSQMSFGKKDGFFVEPAVRWSYFHSLNQAFFLPQLNVTYALNDHVVLKSSAGKQAQWIRQFNHENVLGQTQQFFALGNGSSIPIGQSTNYMLGMWASKGNISFDVEMYYRTLDGAITHATNLPRLRPKNSIPVFRIFSGEARYYGVDFTTVYESKKWFSMVTYTISKSENRFRAIFKNQFYPTPEDSRHQFKWINTLSIGKFDVSINYFGATGRPYLDLSDISNVQERENLNILNYIKNLSDYHRLDVGVSFKLQLFRQESQIGFSVFNLTNHTNVKYRQFVYEVSGVGLNQPPRNSVLGSDVTQLDRTFNLSFSITFTDKR